MSIYKKVLDLVDNREELEESLEAIVDKHSIATVLNALSAICDAKAEHVMSNWQDKEMVKEWYRVSAEVAKIDAADL